MLRIAVPATVPIDLVRLVVWTIVLGMLCANLVTIGVGAVLLGGLLF